MTFLFCHNNLYSQSIINLEDYKDENGWYSNFASAGVTLYAVNFFDEYNEQLGLLENDKMILSRPDDGNLEADQLTFKQYYKDIEVENAYFIFHQKNGVIKEIQPHIVTSLDIDVSNSLTEDKARDIVLSDMNAEEYAWENPTFENGIKISTGNPNATLFPKGELLIAQVGGVEMIFQNYIFAWHFNILTSSPYGSHNVYVNAISGNIISTCNPNGQDFFSPINLTMEYDLQSAISDEFNGSYNSSLWKFEEGAACFDTADKSINYPSNISFRTVPDVYGQSEIMQLTTKGEYPPLTDTCPSLHIRRWFDASGAALSSKEPYGFGYYELRCRYKSRGRPVQVSQSFWMYAAWNPIHGYPDDRYCEVDVFEHFPYDYAYPNPEEANSHYTMCTHGGDSSHPWCQGGDGSCFNPNMCNDLSNEFHTFGINWTPTTLEYFFDGYPVYNSNTQDKTHTIDQLCSSFNWPVSKLLPMFIFISSAIPKWVLDLPTITDIHNYQIDYFRFYKNKPKINGPLVLCPGNTATYNATMFGGNNTTDVFSWSISGGGIIIGSATGSSITVQPIGSLNQFTLTVTATETISGVVDNNPTTKHDVYSSPRVSSSSIVILKSGGPNPSLITLLSDGHPCQTQVAIIDDDSNKQYWFSPTGTNHWTLGVEKSATFNGIHYGYWAYGSYLPYSTFSVYAKTTNICGQSSGIVHYIFNTNNVNCPIRLASNIRNRGGNGLQIAPNIFSSAANISFDLTEPTTISLKCFNSFGVLVETILESIPHSEGHFVISHYFNTFPEGAYYMVLENTEKREVCRFMKINK